MVDITAPILNMTSQKIILLKFTTLIGLSLIVSWIAFGTFKGVNGLPQKNETSTEDTLINSTTGNATLRDRIVNYGMEYLGTPYVAAGSSKDGFDCSGFVYYVFKHFKIQVPRSSPQYENFGKEIPIDKVKKGDILVFLSPTSNIIGHLGIVTNPKGMESDFIHSTSGRQMKVVITSLKTVGYKSRFVKAVSALN